MKGSRCFFLLLFLVFLIGNASAYSISPTGSDSDQNVINEALKAVYNDGGGTVYLEEGIYTVNGPIYIGSNTILTGDKNAIIRVSSSSSQWFTGNIGIIMPMDGVILKNVEIHGFQIDGNCDEFPASYADYGNGKHNAERLIFLRGYSNMETGFMSNIIIHDMTLHDAFSDGIHISFARNVHCYNNLISNCQHEGIFWTCVIDGIADNNKIAGITSDCFRSDNGVNNLITYNYFHSYTGDNNNGENKGGHQGVQISDKGYSHNGGVIPGKNDLPTKTTNIEVSYNTFSGDKRMNFWIDSTNKGVSNVYIHDNVVIDGETLETEGIPVEINGEIVIDHDFMDNISESNPPSLEMSKKVFSTIFDVRNMEFSESGYVPQEVIIPHNPEWEPKGKNTEAYIFLAGYEGQITLNNETYIPQAPSECAIILTDTKNLAERPDGQSSELKLEDMDNGELKATLNVETEYKVKVKKHKKVSIAGKSINVPYTAFKKKSEHVKFTKSFEAPEVFPVISSDDVNVTVEYQNNSINPHATVTVNQNDGSNSAITGVTYKYNGSSATEYRLIGYVHRDNNGYKMADFKETNTWKFSDDKMSYSYQALYIKGSFDVENLQVVVKTPFGEIPIEEFNYIEKGDPMDTKINPAPFVIIIVLFIILRPLLQELSFTFGRMK